MTDHFTYTPRAQFRGSRRYYHSTDLYETILRGAEDGGAVPSGGIKLRIRSKITRAPHYSYQKGDARGADAQASCTMMCGNDRWTVAVVEGESPIREVVQYDEERAFAVAVVSPAGIAISSRTGMRPIEVVTALAVRLHKIELPPPPGRRWMLGELSLSRPLREDDAEVMTIKIEKNLGGRFTQCSLTGKDGQIGATLFVLSDG